MTKLEQNNLDTQIKLMTDIIDNYNMISYNITTKGKALIEHLANGKYDYIHNTYTFTQEDFLKMYNIAYFLRSESEFYKLGNLVEKAVETNKIKTELLVILPK